VQKSSGQARRPDDFCTEPSAARRGRLDGVGDGEGDDTVPERWVLGTPTRAREVWGNPATLLVCAVFLAFLAVVFRSVPVGLRVVGLVGAAAIAGGAVVYFVAGLRAYRELTYEASWRLHCTWIVVGHGTVLLYGLLGLAVGYVGVIIPAVLGGVIGTRRWIDPDRPRFDVLAAIVTEGVIGVACLVAIPSGLLVRSVPTHISAGWVASSVVLVVVLWSIWLDRRALRTAPAR
jgi:hypothetical protein